MIFQQNQPSTLLPRQLDRFLADGWYRRGQTLFTTHFVAVPEGLYNAPWLRLDVTDYEFRKSLRRILRRNGVEFEIHDGPATIDDQKKELMEVFRRQFKGDYYESLESALFGEKVRSTIFDTREITVWYEGKLVGYSFFDVGENSVASILGIYDPEFSRYSLGVYTMLLEIEWCRQESKKFYYPGYAVPGNSRFDYKLRLGEIDYLDPSTGDWRPWSEFRFDTAPLEKLRAAMKRVRTDFRSRGRFWHIGCYFNFECPCELLVREGDAAFLQFPLFLAPDDLAENEHPLIVEFDLASLTYRLSQCRSIHSLPFPHHEHKLEAVSYPVPFDVAQFVYFGSLIREKVIGESTDPFELLKMASF